jgi:two-component system cell cycle sensor histidine kinase/response regulator CckA
MEKTPLRILHVEDQERDVTLLTRHLVRSGYDPTSERVETPAAMKAALESKEWDVILCDYSMPHFSALGALALLKETGQDIPLIIISGTIGEESAVEAMRAGAHDYLMKDNLTRLAPAIERELNEAGNRRTRRQMEQGLRESEDRYRDLVEHSHDLICTHDLEGRLLSVNQAAARAMGSDQQTLLGQNIRAALLPEHHAEFDSYIAEIQKEGVAHGLMAVQTRTGEKRFWEYTNTLRTEGVAVSIVRGVAHDVTEQRLAQQELIKSEERYRELVENAHDIIYTHDLEGNYTSTNNAGEQITGYTREETLSLNIAQMVAPDHIEAAHQVIARQLVGEKVTAYELDIIAKDGRPIAVEVNTRIILENGAPVGVQGIARDVTERKQLESQFRQAQKMESVGMLAGGIAHDFNNLLTVILSHADLALTPLNVADPLARNLKEIIKASERAASLTRQLLAFSRKQILQPKVLDLNSVIPGILGMVERLVGEDIELVIRPGIDLGRIKADPGQIEQVIINLVVNARDAMPKGGKITVGTNNVYLDDEKFRECSAISSGWHVCLTITDTGQGIDNETLTQIFDPFFTTKEFGKGTGLGLATVYGIVKQSGGGIRVSSEVDNGTSFSIYLPMIDDKISEPERVAERLTMAEGAETILLAEDDEMVRHLTREALELYGYTVLEAADGNEALLLSGDYQGTIHLLLTDVVMPLMSGKDLADQLLTSRPETRVLYMSGYTDHAIVHHGVLDGNIAFLNKPFTPDLLARKVAGVLHNDTATATRKNL